jgi:hypothetical protein
MKYIALNIVAIVLVGCATSMTPAQFMEKFPNATKSVFYDQASANKALANKTCKLLVTKRSYAAPLGITVSDDIRNAAKGVDEWVRVDGGNAYILNNFEWMPVGTEAYQLIVYFDTMLCYKETPHIKGI